VKCVARCNSYTQVFAICYSQADNLPNQAEENCVFKAIVIHPLVLIC